MRGGSFFGFSLKAIAVLVFYINSAAAGTFVAMQPQQFVRGSGSPVTETTSFSVKNPNTSYTAHIVNGGLEDTTYEYVSSSTVVVNGTSLFTQSEFNQNVSNLDKPASLQSSNTVEVTLFGKPGGAMILSIDGVDNDLPSITPTVTPAANASGWHNSDPTISFDCTVLRNL